MANRKQGLYAIQALNIGFRLMAAE